MDALFFSCLIFTRSISFKNQRWTAGSESRVGAKAWWCVMESSSASCHASAGCIIHSILLSMFLKKKISLLYFQLSNQKRNFCSSKSNIQKEISYLVENSLHF